MNKNMIMTKKDEQSVSLANRQSLRARQSLSIVSAFVMAMCLAGCAASDVAGAKPTTGRAPQLPEIPGNEETVRGDEDPAVVTLAIGSALREHKLSRSEPLSTGIVIPTTNLKGVPVTSALEAVLAGTDISLSWDAKNWENRLVSVTNLSGPLPRVVEKICNAARVFCSHRHGLLELREKETFLIDLPTIANKVGGDGKSSTMSNTMAEAVSELAGNKVKVDSNGGTLIYTTDVDGQESVHEYLEQIRNGRPLIVMQVHVWEVTLDKENAQGINWSNFKLPTWGGNWESIALAGSTGFTTIASPGVSIGATTTGKLTSSSTLQFLSTQGSVQNISSPQLTFVSGSDAEFRVGGKQYYVSQVGLSSSVSGTTTSSTTTSSVSTDSIETGLTLDINGAYESGVITANLALKIQNLTKINSVTTSDTQIQLPITTDRKMSTMIRVRPGDNIILAGMVGSKDSNSNEGIPLPFGGHIQTYGDDSYENTEIVILMKPSVVFFSDQEGEARTPVTARTQSPKAEAHVSDKGGVPPAVSESQRDVPALAPVVTPKAVAPAIAVAPEPLSGSPAIAVQEPAVTAVISSEVPSDSADASTSSTGDKP